jgi:hypothetical protein
MDIIWPTTVAWCFISLSCREDAITRDSVYLIENQILAIYGILFLSFSRPTWKVRNLAKSRTFAYSIK